MRITICDDKKELGRQAAKRGAEEIRIAIAKHGYANVAFVTGLSQVETLRNLRTENVDWSKVNIFFLEKTSFHSSMNLAPFIQSIEKKQILKQP